MSGLDGTRVWLVGASGGIGASLARVLLASGATVAASARDENRLAQLGGGENLLPLPLDVCHAAQVRAAADRIQNAWGGLDWAIINAGDCEYLNPREWDADLIERMMAVNFFGFTHCAEAALPLLENATGRGLLAYCASAVVYCPLPRAAAYGASKAAAAHFLRSLEADFPAVDFSLICPGFVDTPLTRRNDFAMPFLQSADAAAATILSGLRRRRAEIAFPRRLIWPLKVLAALPPPLRRRLQAGMANQ